MKILIALIMFLFLLVSVEPAFSHSGGTDSSGCHAGSQSLIIVMTMMMTMGVLLQDQRIPMEVLY